jgi:hypothetical protein
MRAARTGDHATVGGGAFASSGVVADFVRFLSAFVLAQPSPWAVFGPGWGFRVFTHPALAVVTRTGIGHSLAMSRKR